VSDGTIWDEPTPPEGGGGRWNSPAPPEEGAAFELLPVDGLGPGPEPLPLPPGARGTGAPPRPRRVGLIIAIAVASMLVLCAVGGIVAFSEFSGVDPFAALDMSGSSPGPAVGVHSVRWAGDGRFVVVEYGSGGVDATTSIIAWDSKTKERSIIDGFRLVATEPWSTEVWLTPAVQPEDRDSEVNSPWDEAPWGPPIADGEGAAWRWDVATPGNEPVELPEPTWEPWKGPSGTKAVLAIDDDYGLWPISISFETSPGTVEGETPEHTLTFLPVGWSPSGRYFAILSDDRWYGTGATVAILDATDGSIVASFETTVGPDGEIDRQMGGAAWDPDRDVLWVATTATDGSEDVDVAVLGLEASGTVTPLPESPWEAGKTVSGGAIVGRDTRGVLLFVESATDKTVWRISDGSAGLLSKIPGTFFGIMADSYREGGGMLGMTSPVGEGAEPDPLAGPLLGEDQGGDSAATLMNVDGTGLRVIWPPE
jgi:hypothetical protein